MALRLNLATINFGSIGLETKHPTDGESVLTRRLRPSSISSGEWLAESTGRNWLLETPLTTSGWACWMTRVSRCLFCSVTSSRRSSLLAIGDLR